MRGSEMRDYEYMYRALVRRLIGIADDAPHLAVEDQGGRHARLIDYDRVARAHEMTVQTWKEMEEDDVS